ncbi:hypothetical protein D3C75_1033600 [compost metagenome]
MPPPAPPFADLRVVFLQTSGWKPAFPTLEHAVLIGQRLECFSFILILRCLEGESRNGTAETKDYEGRHRAVRPGPEGGFLLEPSNGPAADDGDGQGVCPPF